ncbi:MAG: hypothetical protein M0017_11265, partial [Desulfobacteraceae bacterium]|nr:hypothetical protein [Desulfobacteraceae bacterium]
MSTRPRPEPPPSCETPAIHGSFGRRVLVATFIVLALILLVGLFFYTIRVLVLVFLGILIAVFLR